MIVPTVQAAIIEEALTNGSGSGSGMGPEPVSVSDLANMSDSTVVVIKLSTEDLNEIKRRPNLATTRRNTVFISITEELVIDTFGNPNMPIFDLMAERVIAFGEDKVNPELVRYNLNLSSNELTLSFSETVDVSTLNVSAFTLHSDVIANASESYRLTGGTLLTSNDPVVVLELSEEDMNQLRNLTELAVSPDSTFLSITSSAIRDMNGNEVVEVTDFSVATYRKDEVPPTLDSFHLDMNLGLLHLTFSETVNASSFDPSSITLQNDALDDALNYTLQNATLEDYNSNILIASLSDEDQNQIKYYWNLATDLDDTFVSVLPSAVADMNGNSLVEIPASEAQNVTLYTTDICRAPAGALQISVLTPPPSLCTLTSPSLHRMSLTL